MRRAYILLASFIVVLFTGLFFATSLIWTTQSNLNARISYLHQVDISAQKILYMVTDIVDNDSAKIKPNELAVLKELTQLYRPERLNDYAPGWTSEFLFGKEDALAATKSLTDLAARLLRALNNFTASETRMEIRFFGSALINQIEMGFFEEIEEIVIQKQVTLALLKNATLGIYLCAPLIVGLLFVVFWKLSIGPLMRARDRNLLELQNSRERADRLRKQAVQAAGAKSQFLTFVSHELRTPLNGVLGLSDELKEHVLHEVPKRLVENISDSGEELLRLINAMISFTEASQKDTDVAVFIQDVKDAQNAKSPKPEMSAQALPENLKVLAADDNKTNRMVLSKILQRLGVTHDIADDGDTALAAYQNGDYDVVLLDIAMPRMRGTTALAEMLALDEERNLPLAIAITANTLKEQLDEYHEVGFDFCLAKPIKKAVLVDTIANGLAARALHS